MRQVVDVVHGILRLAFDRDRLVLLDVPCVLSIHGDGAIIAEHLHVETVRSDVGEFDVKGC